MSRHNNYFKLIDILKEEGRMSLTRISKKTNIPITTLYDHLKTLEKENIIKIKAEVNWEKMSQFLVRKK